MTREATVQRLPTWGEADLRGAKLMNVNLSLANLEGAIYNAETWWPSGFDPQEAGAARCQ